MKKRWSSLLTTTAGANGPPVNLIAVSWRSVWSPVTGNNCLGKVWRDTGQSRVPAPPHRITGQIIATVITWVFAAVVSFVLLKVLDVTIGLRVTPDEEEEGLDVTQHGEEGYIF